MAKEIESVLRPSFILRSKLSNDRHSQQFILFLKEREVNRYIKRLRGACRIDPSAVRKRLKEYSKLAKQAQKSYEKTMQKNGENPFNANKDPEYDKAKNNRDNYWFKLKKEISSILTFGYIHHILDLFNKPWSWEEPLSCYILTEKIIPPSVRCKVYPKDDRVIVEVSPEANADDYREAYKQIEHMQKFIRGHDVKRGRKKPKLKEKLKIIDASKKYKNLYDVIDKVYPDSKTDSLTLDNKRRAVIRKTKQRYKKYL